MTSNGDGARALPESPAAERNKGPILEVLRTVLPASGTVLEIASGTGQHVVHFARALPALVWQPSEPDDELRSVIVRRLAAEALPNVLEPLPLDVHGLPWPIARADAIFCSNMIHIAPWSAAIALFRGAGALLGPASLLVLYGPFKIGGAHTAPSNEAFDESLRARNPAWGVRDLDGVAALAAEHAFVLRERVQMPANNLTVVFERTAG